METVALLDHHYLRENYHQAGFSYLLPEILELFRDQATLHLETIEQHLMQGNLHEVAQEAHTLKGAAGSVGAAALAQLAHHLEESAPVSQIAEVSQQVRALRELIAQTDTAITTELVRLGTGADDDLDQF
ncbi:Hpt domain-containing protein [Trichlorobacter thiogenes]|uniref:Hpt domain-containing protein n=1 Tax=Trichlorobacter thiogenes TaxID=115783 RepID=A0A1T4L8P8_9BACT|nr:Hpt domain-containing protein [Trichlorobacter thiogenes]SJZ51044.1 Hpt domain-containing protein [Trichlorobacter thiogenes]